MPTLSVFQTVLLAIFGALAVSGVLIFALVVGGGGGNTIGPITIWGTLEESAFRAVIRQLAEEDERLAQVSYVEKDAEGYVALLTEALAENTGPDLFLLRQDYAVRDAGKVFPIPFDSFSETQFRNTFIEAADPYLSPNGVLAIPILADPLVLYWNRDMFSSAGYANPPRYWDELDGMSQNITKKNDAGQILKSTVSFGEYRNVNNAKDILATLILQAGSPITAKDSTGQLVSALQPGSGGGAQATEAALRFYTEFADPSKARYSWSRALPESRSAFASGDLALYIGFASEKPIIARMNPNLNFAAAPLPQARSADHAINTARVYALATSKTAQNPSGAFLIASLLASTDVSQSFSAVVATLSHRAHLPRAPRSRVIVIYSTNKQLFPARGPIPILKGRMACSAL